MDYPSDEFIERFHHKYAPTDAAFNDVYLHCQIVWEIAKQLIEDGSLQVDKDLVKAGCLLHDIGVYKLYGPDGNLIESVQYLTHGRLGSEILRKESLDESLQRMLENHIGVGLNKSEIIERNLPLPPQDFIPTTAEQRLVAYADNFHSKSRPPIFKTADSYRDKLMHKFPGKEKIFDSWVQEFGEPDLVPLANKYHHEIAS